MTLSWYKLAKRTVQFILSPVRPFFDKRVHRIRGGPARGMLRRGGFSFIPAPPTKDEVFLDGLDLAGKTVFDVGANIGIMSLYFSKRVGEQGAVHAFEPNPNSVSLIRGHVELNEIGNVNIHHLAIGDAESELELVVPRGKRGQGTLDGEISARFKAGRFESFMVPVTTIDILREGERVPAPDLVKIDTEGFEIQCLHGMRRTILNERPRLFIEMHGLTPEAKQENARVVVGFLSEHGYRIHHVQRDCSVHLENYELASRGHLFCQFP